MQTKYMYIHVCVYILPFPLEFSILLSLVYIFASLINVGPPPPQFTLSDICIGCTLGSKPEMLNKPKLPLFKFFNSRENDMLYEN